MHHYSAVDVVGLTGDVAGPGTGQKQGLCHNVLGVVGPAYGNSCVQGFLQFLYTLPRNLGVMFYDIYQNFGPGYAGAYSIYIDIVLAQLMGGELSHG